MTTHHQKKNIQNNKKNTIKSKLQNKKKKKFLKKMANLKLVSTMSNSIISTTHFVPFTLCISRAFVSPTRPNEIAKIDKETAQKIKEAAVAVKEGAQEVKSVGDSLKETISSSAGNVISEMSKKVLDKATENEEKSTWETIKEKVTGK